MNRSPLLQVVGPADNWILQQLARKLVAKLPYARFTAWKPEPSESTRIVYYVNYALYHERSGCIDIAFFTHYDESQRFLKRARQVDFCVCMAKQYADWLHQQGVRNVVHLPMGFDYYRYRPRLVLGVVGLLEQPRKGRHLVERLRQLPFIEIVTTEGRLQPGQLRDVYQRVDYVLIPATVEGGPMCLLEGLAMGKPVIAPASVGMVPEFPDTPHIRRYPAGDSDALVQVAKACYQEKVERTQLVQDRTWDAWAEAHHNLFMRLLRERKLAAPRPAAGFRFGMLSELEIPSGMDVGTLEDAVDEAAAHLFYGEYQLARTTLAGVLPQFPFAEKLLDTIPDRENGKGIGPPTGRRRRGRTEKSPCPSRESP